MEPLDPARVIAAVHSRSNGAIALFIGTVREINENRAVLKLEYSVYESMAVRELDRIVQEASNRFGQTDIVVQHRTGVLELGEISVIVAAAHPHRAPAFDACRYVIEELKRRVPIWKREQYSDGSNEWVGCANHALSQSASG
jgi:molybdopterin synthase catalytic subunit